MSQPDAHAAGAASGRDGIPAYGWVGGQWNRVHESWSSGPRPFATDGPKRGHMHHLRGKKYVPTSFEAEATAPVTLTADGSLRANTRSCVLVMQTGRNSLHALSGLCVSANPVLMWARRPTPAASRPGQTRRLCAQHPGLDGAQAAPWARSCRSSSSRSAGPYGTIISLKARF